jgi:hypothetical protein
MPVESSDNEQAVGEPATAEIVKIAEHRRSRYERNSRSLPHLGDDPDWTPATFEIPTPITDDVSQRWYDRFRR